MNNQTKDWQKLLRQWLQQNPKTIPDDLEQLRQDFVLHFPIDSLQDMTLDQYAVGKPDSFCYWLEFKTNELGGIRGGSAAKFGVWWSKSEERWRWNSFYQDAEDALTHIKQGLIALIDAVRNQQFDDLDKIGSKLLGPNRYSLRCKPLYLYFPENFLPISNLKHLEHFSHCFGYHLQGDIIAMNRQLLAYLRSLPEFDGVDPPQMGTFLYETMPPQKGDTTPIESQPPKKGGAIPPESQLPKQPDSIIPPINNRTKVFISYSEANEEEMRRLRVFLKAAKVHDKKIEWWENTQIKPGTVREDEIKKALASTYIAILLVSVDYLASEPIMESELYPLLTANEEDGVTILAVILGPCPFRHTKLAKFQTVNDPSHPLSKMNKHEVDEVWNKVVETILNPDNS